MELEYSKCFGNSSMLLTHIYSSLEAKNSQLQFLDKLSNLYKEFSLKFEKLITQQSPIKFPEYGQVQIINIVQQQQQQFISYSQNLQKLVAESAKMTSQKIEMLDMVKTKQITNYQLLCKRRILLEKQENAVKLTAYNVQKLTLEMELNSGDQNQKKLIKLQDKLDGQVKLQFATVEDISRQETLYSQFEQNSLKILQKLDKQRLSEVRSALKQIETTFIGEISLQKLSTFIDNFDVNQLQILLQEQFIPVHDTINVTVFRDFATKILTLPRGGTLQEEIQKAQYEINRCEAENGSDQF